MSQGCWSHLKLGTELAQAKESREAGLVSKGRGCQKPTVTGRDGLARGHQAPRNWSVHSAVASEGAHGQDEQVPH